MLQAALKLIDALAHLRQFDGHAIVLRQQAFMLLDNQAKCFGADNRLLTK